MFRPRGGIWELGVPALSLGAVMVFAVAVALSWRPSLVDRAPHGLQARARAAEAIMRRAAEVIRDARRAEGVASEADDGSVMSALLGAELTPITTTLGNLEAKRIATKPAWASALVLRLDRAGLHAGDVVAAGLSGSFPGLDLALVVACQSLDLRLVAISSVTSSSWGANQPGFTWPEMEARLVRAGVTRPVTVAVSTGGAEDRAADLDSEGRATAERIAEAVSAEMGVPVLRPTNFEHAIALHLNSYSRAAAGRRRRATRFTAHPRFPRGRRTPVPARRRCCVWSAVPWSTPCRGDPGRRGTRRPTRPSPLPTWPHQVLPFSRYPS